MPRELAQRRCVGDKDGLGCGGFGRLVTGRGGEAATATGDAAGSGADANLTRSMATL